MFVNGNQEGIEKKYDSNDLGVIFCHITASVIKKSAATYHVS